MRCSCTTRCGWGRQDFKLNTLRWRLLPLLGGVAAELAGLLGAHAHLDHYLRDLGPLTVNGSKGSTTHASLLAGTAAPLECIRHLHGPCNHSIGHNTLSACNQCGAGCSQHTHLGRYNSCHTHSNWSNLQVPGTRGSSPWRTCTGRWPACWPGAPWRPPACSRPYWPRRPAACSALPMSGSSSLPSHTPQVLLPPDLSTESPPHDDWPYSLEITSSVLCRAEVACEELAEASQATDGGVDIDALQSVVQEADQGTVLCLEALVGPATFSLFSRMHLHATPCSGTACMVCSVLVWLLPAGPAM